MKRIIFAIAIANAGSPTEHPQILSPTTIEFTKDELDALIRVVLIPH
jgi:hypothetical protein